MRCARSRIASLIGVSGSSRSNTTASAPVEGAEEEDPVTNDNLLITVLNLMGGDAITAAYTDGVRPDGGKVNLESNGRLVTDGAVAVTDEGYNEPVELLHVGEKLFVVVTDPDLDLTDERDHATVVIMSESGEEESVKLEETLSHSGVFTGSFSLKAKVKPEAGNFNPEAPQVECFFGDKLAVNYLDEAAGTDGFQAKSESESTMGNIHKSYASGRVEQMKL